MSAPLAIDAGVSPGPQVVRRVLLRLVPLLVLLYLLNYLDRTNVALAKLQMNEDLRFDDAIYAAGASAFFVGYFLFEVPSNMILERIGARVWIARIMITWGLVSAAMMFVQGRWSFYILRFLLGSAEAGFLPGIMLYLTYWVPSAHRARAIAWFLTSTTLSGVVGGPLAAGLLSLNGVAGLRGWQWIYLAEGVPTVLMGVAVLVLLPDRPRQVRWLTDAEKTWLESELEAERRASPHAAHTHLGYAFRSGPVWWLSVTYFLHIMGYYGVALWLPTVLKDVFLRAYPDAKSHANLAASLLTAVPYAVATITMLAWATWSDRTGKRRGPVVASYLLGALGLALVCWAVYAGSLVLTLAAFSVAAVGIWSAMGPFWSLPPLYTQGAAAAAAIAWINSVGNLGGGFVGPNITGLLKDHYHSDIPGMVVDVTALLLAAGMVALLREPRAAHAGGGPPPTPRD